MVVERSRKHVQGRIYVRETDVFREGGQLTPWKRDEMHWNGFNFDHFDHFETVEGGKFLKMDNVSKQISKNA